MKVSYHVMRTGSAKHNDRSFDISTAKHINPELVSDNLYIRAYRSAEGQRQMSFAEVEKKFYTSIFTPWLEHRNKKALSTKHPSRVKTIEQLMTEKNTRPEEAIYQIGDKDNHPSDPKILQDIYMELNKYSRQLVGRHCRVLDVALHMDEATPHIHERRVWVYQDPDDKLYKISQREALKRAGIPLPDPDKPVSKTNNRKITYDRLIRTKFIELCRQRGLEIEDEPEQRKHMLKSEYIYRQQQRELKTMEQEKNKYPLSIRERAELEELRRFKYLIEKDSPEAIERLHRKEEERRRRKEAMRKQEERKKTK